MSSPLVSFLVPCHNYGRFLPDCVESILQQSYSNLELLILDDASTDNTSQVALSFKDPRVTYICQQENLGLPGNINSGIARCRGEFAWLISADDFLADHEALKRAVKEFETGNSPSMVWSPPRTIGDSGEWHALFYQGPEKFELATACLAQRLVSNNFICAPCVLARTDSYRKIGGFRAEVPYLTDWYCWFRFSLMGKTRYIPEPLACYRVHPSSWTSKINTSRTAQLLLETVRLHLAMWELTEGMTEFRKPVRDALRQDMRVMFNLWLGRPSDRERLAILLSAKLRIGSLTQSRTDISKLFSEELLRARRKLLAEAIRALRPRLALRILLLRGELDAFCTSVTQG